MFEVKKTKLIALNNVHENVRVMCSQEPPNLPITVNSINIQVKLMNAFEVFAVPISKLNAESKELVCRAHF